MYFKRNGRSRRKYRKLTSYIAYGRGTPTQKNQHHCPRNTSRRGADVSYIRSQFTKKLLTVFRDMANVNIDWEVDGIISPEVSVSAMIRVICTRKLGESGTFWTWEGKVQYTIACLCQEYSSSIGISLVMPITICLRKTQDEFLYNKEIPLLFDK